MPTPMIEFSEALMKIGTPYYTGKDSDAAKKTTLEFAEFVYIETQRWTEIVDQIETINNALIAFSGLLIVPLGDALVDQCAEIVDQCEGRNQTGAADRIRALKRVRT